MTTIQWRPEINALTSPQSYVPRHVPRTVLGNDELAARMEQRNPLYTQTLGKSFFMDLADELREQLVNGNQVTLDGLFTCHITFTGRLDGPDDPLPPLADCLQVRLYPSRRLAEDVRRDGQAERLPEEKKLPLISSAQDSLLKLKDVLNPDGALVLLGDNLASDQTAPDTLQCVIAGTQSGSVVQTRLLKAEPGEIMLMPEIPAQAHPWNNEYTVSVTVRYTERGSLRTGTYSRMLRAPLTVSGLWNPTPPTTGVLTGKEASPHVNVTGGSVAANETLRIQAVYDSRADALLFSLLDMQEGGKAGTAVTVTANGIVTLPGFSGSAVTILNLWVDKYTALKEMIRSSYGGRVVDVLKVETA
jgi:hypothetical protein